MENKLTAIYFTGFYETYHAQIFDDILERECEYFKESYEASDSDVERFMKSVYMNAHFGNMYLDYAKRYAEKYNQFFEETCGINLNLVFESLSSPKYYNFETDRIFCHIPLDKLKAVYANLRDDILQAVIEDKFTSRSGFISFYSNVLDDWKEKPLSDYDHNEINTVLDAYTIQCLMKNDTTLSYEKACNELDDCLNAYGFMENEQCNGVFDNIFWDHVGKESHAIVKEITKKTSS